MIASFYPPAATIAAAMMILPATALLAEESTEKSQTDVVLVENGKPGYVIVTADQPDQAVQLAVDELNYWVNRITGTSLSITTVSQWDGKQPYIAVGKSKLTAENQWDSGEFAQEEARVFVEPGRIALLGNDNSGLPGIQWTGTYYAVIEFAQKSLNVRWIWPGESGEVFTPRETLTVKTGSWKWAPDILLNRELRNSSRSASHVILETLEKLGLSNDEAWQSDRFERTARWLRRERMNKPSAISFGHAFTNWWDKHSASHPDWFAKPPEDVTQRGGKGVKLNISNPEVADQVVREWAEARKADPVKGRYMSIAPNDSRGFDTRPETRAWDAPELAKYSDKEIFNGGEPVLSDRFVRFWNILSEKARKIDPNVTLTSYAYRNYRKPPLTDIRFTGDTILAYTGPEGYYPDEPFIVDEWREWARRGAKMAWRPNVFHCGHGIPYLYSRQIFKDFKTFRENALCSTDFDSLVGHWSTQGLNYYIVAELHNRPDATYDELVGEYYGAFGPAAETMRRYHELFEARTRQAPDLLRKHELVPNLTWGGWWKGHMRLVPLFMDEATVKSARELIAKAKTEVGKAPEVFSQRVAFVETGLEHACLMADAFRELRLEQPANTVDLSKARTALRPLWLYRQKHLSDFAFPTLRMFISEQRQLGIWQSYVLTPQEQLGNLYPVNKGWKLRLDADNRGIKEAWQDVEATTGWQDGAVSQPWRRAIDTDKESKIVWYRTEFEVPELDDTGERVYLNFASVDAEVKIWVNGKLVNERGYPHNGNYDSWSEPFEVEVTSHVKSRPGNKVVLRVESESPNAGVTGEVTLRIGK